MACDCRTCKLIRGFDEKIQRVPEADRPFFEFIMEELLEVSYDLAFYKYKAHEMKERKLKEHHET